MAYSKHTWTDNELITKEKLNNIENGIANIELTPGPKGDKGDRGETGPQGEQGPQGEPGVVQDATTEVKGVVKMAAKVDVIGVADCVTAKAEYTQADIEGMVTLTNKNKERLNELITALKEAGIVKA